MGWLGREHPELVAQYQQLYSGGAYAPKEYRSWLAAKVKPVIRRHGLERGREDPATGGVRSSALGRSKALGRSGPWDRMRGPDGERSLIAEELHPVLAARAMPQPTLF